MHGGGTVTGAASSAWPDAHVLPPTLDIHIYNNYGVLHTPCMHAFSSKNDEGGYAMQCKSVRAGFQNLLAPNINPKRNIIIISCSHQCLSVYANVLCLIKGCGM